MNLDKSTKRIAKRVKKGFQGYPQISLAYFGESADYASEVVVGFVAEEGDAVQEQKFTSKCDARKDETIVRAKEVTARDIVNKTDSAYWHPKYP